MSSIADLCDKSVLMVVNTTREAEWVMRNLRIFAAPVGAAMTGRRFRKIIVAPLDDGGSQVAREAHRQFVDEVLVTKLDLGGEMIRLTALEIAR